MMNDMRVYVGTKVINAAPMTRGDYNIFRGWQLPADECGEDEGYLVEYIDQGAGSQPNTQQFSGYVSWSPKALFERAYVQIKSLPFGSALELMKQGRLMTRKGWNGKGQYVVLIPGDHLAKSAGYGFGEYLGEFTFCNVLALKNAQGVIVPGWTPSTGDLFATDWELYKLAQAE
ncbi:DUF2829 domain-containing protein [Citrobacter freundii]|uniref:DUF2829 domain-containing protein n=1 Tax=Citrobacter freundii TaxID=546 RepID=UPI002B2483AA|nr:DUF2829 domain-containing protein [Citrobacter freundii]MEB2478169.1 DUF2829 domain-containing protein [Citrobacter freundii]